MRQGSTSFGACEVRCWRWLFGNEMPISLGRDFELKWPMLSMLGINVGSGPPQVLFLLLLFSRYRS